MHAKRLALVLVVTLAGAALAVGVAGAQEVIDDELTVSVDQADDGSATVTVEANGTTVENATVGVETVDENDTYAGRGEYATDENGTVSLPAPEEEVTVAVTATVDDATASTDVTLEAADDGNESAFGKVVSAFVQDLVNDNETEGGIGDSVSEFVRNNNPAADKIPDRAGPPENRTAGPPEHAGPGDDESDDKRGPPEHAGGDDDDDEKNDEEEEDDGDDDEKNDEEEEDDGDDGGEGPPDSAGP